MGAKSGILPPPVSRVAVEYFCRSEWARHLDDVMVRRTSWRHYHHDHLEIAARTARWMATSLNWDESAIQTELIRYQELTGTIVVAPPQYLAVGRSQLS